MILALLGLGLGRGLVSYGLGTGAPTSLVQPQKGFYVTQPAALPLWLRGAESDDESQGVAFERSFGKTKDDALAVLKDAVKARWPAFAAPDALPLMGNDRRILRAPGEQDDAYAARLETAHDLWLWGGTPTGILNLLVPYGYDVTTCAVVPNWAGILEGNPDWFSRFIVLLAAVRWTTDTPWDGPVDWFSDGDGTTWDSTITLDDVQYMLASMRVWKSDESYPVLIGIVLPGGSGAGLWDQSPLTVYDGTLVDFWTDTADPVVLIPVGHVHDEEENIYGTGSAYDDGSTSVWDDGAAESFQAPPQGWHFVN